MDQTNSEWCRCNHPPCSVVPDGIPEMLTDGKISHPYKGANGKRYRYLASDGGGVWSEAVESSRTESA
jgi:hypothetical protein